ncbi:hypothetical protein TRFO_01050 [Tritrichomonas foetus]|uniref:Uncharacterized protein n=1 Tax=Tritrichomonas foetus TaxID=1144522 RepID=A0A1J4KJA0_9EUKA|nr:hypothetical protein TRFO_01050 [Tritrichomonas foetus]|eukprot:OHT11154.1 hypothetical protein TRFO_01050 [Tritrichomonas foetus]
MAFSMAIIFLSPLMTITFYFIAFLLILACMALAFICVIKGFHALLPDSTYFDQQLKQKENNQSAARKKRQKLETDVELSVIYKVQGEKEAVKAQLQCISALIEESFGQNYAYEIICVVDGIDYSMFRYVNSLYQHMSYLIPIYKPIEGIRWLISGIVASNGKIIADAQFLVNEIPALKSDENQVNGIDFIEPISRGPTNLFNARNFAVPVAMTKNAATQIFRHLHMLDFASTNELFSLCKHFNVETRVGLQNFGPKEISLFDVLVNFAASKLTQFMYNHRFWTTVIK